MMILIFLILDGYRPLPPELPWAPQIEIEILGRDYECEELADGLLYCPDLREFRVYEALP